MDAQLERTIAKIHPHDAKVWCGCLTYVEFIHLADAELIQRDGDASDWQRKLEWARGRQAAGDGGSTWFYFTLAAGSKLAQTLGRNTTSAVTIDRRQ